MYGQDLKHPIDGDGYVCAVTFLDGQVHFRSRFVRSAHREHEERERKLLYRGQMGTNPDGECMMSIDRSATPFCLVI